VNGKIYAIGGLLLHAFNTYSGVNEEYDPATDTWVNRASMPTPRANFGIAVYQNKIYCIGGSTSKGVATGVNEVYDPSTDTWKTKNQMPTPRQGLDANVVNGKIYLIGGDSGANASSVNEVYDSQTDTWTNKSSLPNAVSGYASAVVNDKIYVIGGSDKNLTQIYTPETDTWNNGAPIPTTPKGYYPGGAGATTGVLAPKRIYVLGGSEAGLSGMSLNTTLIYDPENDTWSNGAPMPTARSNIGVGVVDDILYAIGGVINWGSYTGANEQYIPIGYTPIGYVAPSPSPTTSPAPSSSPSQSGLFLPMEALIAIAASAVIIIIIVVTILLRKRQK
jgi:N-acetylneuraminic acid mutarotase